MTYGQPTSDTLARQLVTEQDELERYTEDAATYSALADKLLRLRDRANEDIEDARDIAALANIECALAEAELEERRNRRWAANAQRDVDATSDRLQRARADEEREASPMREGTRDTEQQPSMTEERGQG